MEHPGRVELTPENEYLVELHTRYKEDPRDVAAILAHEITHVFLYRAGLWLPNEYDNEILTDTASTYLGVGWLGLNAFRVTESQQPSVNPGQVYFRGRQAPPKPDIKRVLHILPPCQIPSFLTM